MHIAFMTRVVVFTTHIEINILIILCFKKFLDTLYIHVISCGLYQVLEENNFYSSFMQNQLNQCRISN